MTERISVVLPAPLRPTRPTMRPSATCSDRPRSATTDWIDDMDAFDLQHVRPCSILQISSPVT